MLTFSETQLATWLSPILWPFLRILALFTSAPIFSMRSIPMRVKIGLAFLISVCAQPMLAHLPVVSVNSPQALGCVLQQVSVGIVMGFVVRLVFVAVELAGEIVGLQMGLNFAAFFDPMSNAQVSAVSKFFGNIAVLFFIAINGHLLLVMGVVQSFDVFPMDGQFLNAMGGMKLHMLGGTIFSSALWIALPMIALLLFVNLTMGVISRVAPQMNIYAVGFPVTLTVGLLGIGAILPMLEQPMLKLMQQALDLFAFGR